MTDPFAIFRAQCAALIKTQVPEPAGYVFERPPKKEMGHLACNVAFQLTRLRKNGPLPIAQNIVANLPLADAPLVREAKAAAPGFINFFLDEHAYARMVLDSIVDERDLYGQGERGPQRCALIEHTSTNPNKAWHIGHARNAVLGDTLARLFRFAGHDVEVQNYIDDTGKQVADMICGLSVFNMLSEGGSVRVQSGQKLDHVFGDVYARYYDRISAEPALRAELEALATAMGDGLNQDQCVARVAALQAQLNSLDLKRTSERDVSTLQRQIQGWTAVSAVAPDAYTSYERDLSERLEQISSMKAQAESIQHRLEHGDYRDLVLSCVHAQLATAWRLGIYYDLLSWEQDIVRSGLLEETITRISASPVVRVADEGRKKGCLVIEMGDLLPQGAATNLEESDEHSSEVVLVRSNGLPTYVGKDVAYHYWKFGLLDNDMHYATDLVQPDGRTLWTTSPQGQRRDHFPANEVINLIDTRQSYPQQVVAAALRLTGHGDLGFHHLAYGVVSARIDGEEISMSGRFGNGVPADDVLDRAAAFALQRVREKQESALSEDDMRVTAERIAAAAMRYVMVRYNPLTEIVLDPAEMVEFEGNTGAYLLYAYTRIVAILRRAAERGIDAATWSTIDTDLLRHEAELDLVLVLGRFADVVHGTLETLSLNMLAEYAYEVATQFSQFYNKCPILNADPRLDAALLSARLGLAAATAQVMRNLYGILGLDIVERL